MSSPASSDHRVPRLATLGLIAAVIVGAGLVDRRSTPVSAASAIDAMPVAAPKGALSSSWFCAGAAAQPAHSSDGQLLIVNDADRTVHGTVTLVPSQGAPVFRTVQVGPKDQMVVPETLGGGPAAPYLGAIVDLDAGSAAVEQVVTGTQGTTSAPCAASSAGTWHFAAGTTQESSSLTLSLLNPFPDDAIADLSFVTEQGSEAPADFQGILVPARSLVGVDLGSHLRRRASVAATVNARVGRVVAFETQVVAAQAQGTVAAQGAPAPWPPGISLVLGSPSAGKAWWWPTGIAADGMTERFEIYNPGPTEARVSLAVDLDQGSADPFQLTVDAHSVTEVVSNTESRVPKGIGHAARLTSTNGVGVVAERLVQAATPSPLTGIAQVPGSRLLSHDWLVAPGIGPATAATSVAVYNPGPATVTVTISALSGGGETPLDNQRDVEIPARHRAVATVPGAGKAIVVHASGPVAVEREVDPPAKAIGLDAAPGVPLGP